MGAAYLMDISDMDRKITISAKNSLLFNGNQPWRKRDTVRVFDVTMGSFDGAEDCDLVGLFIQSQLNELNLNSGLYRDDGLWGTVVTKRQNEGLKKRICDLFRKNGFKIIIEPNLKITDFLAITLDLNTGNHKLFLKPNNNLLYVNIHS